MRSTLVALAALVGACGSSDDPIAPPDAAAPDTAAPDAAPPSPPVDADPGNLATLSGDVVRTTEPMAGGVGNLYIALFEQDPVTSPSPPAPVGQALVEAADMSGANARIPYEIAGVAVRSAPYYVVAFLDDNMNASMDPATAGPDRGDLVSLDGLASPSVQVARPGTVDFEIVLNTALPF